jgi:hypothetical protein
LHCLGLPSKSHRDNSISSIFLESPHQVDMKNVVKAFKHFFGYFNTLETHSDCHKDMNNDISRWVYFVTGLNLVQQIKTADIAKKELLLLLVSLIQFTLGWSGQKSKLRCQ